MTPHPHLQRLLKRANVPASPAALAAARNRTADATTYAQRSMYPGIVKATDAIAAPFNWAGRQVDRAWSAAAPHVAKATDVVANAANSGNEFVNAVDSTRDYYSNKFRQAVPNNQGIGVSEAWSPSDLAGGAGWVLDRGKDIVSVPIIAGWQGLSRMGNAGSAAARGNWGEAGREAFQGYTRLGSAGLAAAGAPGVGPLSGRALSGLSTLGRFGARAGAVAGEHGLLAAQDSNGANPPPAPAPTVPTRATPNSATAGAPDSGFDFSSMAAFLPLILSMMGGGQQASAQPQYAPRPMTTLDYMGARSPFA